MAGDRYIQFFDCGFPPEPELVGGKCASLVSMTAAQLPVPPGFTVTTVAYDAFMAQSDLAAMVGSLIGILDARDVAAVDAVSRRIRDEICSRPLPAGLKVQTHAAYDALQARFDQEVPVAVRSSATAEDLPDASFAGQQDTYLWLIGAEAILDRIQSCWSSLYTSRAITYRLRNGIADEGLSMAVAVQKMVNARVAGVAITMDPVTGDRSKIAIDASYGVGELVVSGQVTPDNILVDKVMLTIVAETLGDKHAELVPDLTGSTLIEREVDEVRRRRRCLTDAEVVAVAALAKRAERHSRCPQDVEWAIDADFPEGQNVLILQSRAETVHSARPTAASVTPSTTFSLGSLTSRLLGAKP
ncbi:PEP/pyruvate-binding domain-containing protein [Streptomyces sp. SID13031]|uniref:PEP/pyruvate-binding domain-containing protein n=1 Tax=Streptomyces sp. SID13031 TaxID=2706046 RepID=UPI0013C69B7C|nr:PEP/pyruvate-binding domain-containing protein [Streptomyces sp. SID13031]NEA36868.1 phosphoenolpyruvate synthase [Streptomyces sp. SID13031]